ncbi:hypothetical protein pb186bvf_002582 [Paramecium bursaria]
MRSEFIRHKLITYIKIILIRLISNHYNAIQQFQYDQLRNNLIRNQKQY